MSDHVPIAEHSSGPTPDGPLSVPAPSAPAPAASTGRRRPYALLVLVVLGLACLAVGFYSLWRKYEAVPDIPSVDLAGTDPEIAESLVACRQAVQNQPRSAEAWGRLGMVLRAHKMDKSARCYAQAQALSPNDYRWPYLLGLDLLDTDQDAAVPRLRQAVQFCGDEPAPALRLAEVLLDRGELAEAEALFEKGLEKGKANDARAHLGLGQIARQRGEREAALGHLRQAIGGAPGTKAAHLALAQACWQFGEKAAAEEEQRIAARIALDTPWPDPCVEAVNRAWVGLRARMSRIVEFDLLGYREEAVVAARQAAFRYPESAQARLVLGEMLNKSKNVMAAEPVLREAIRLDPERAKSYFELAYALHAQGKVKEAVESYRQSLEKRPDYAPAHFNLALGLMTLKDDAGALEGLQAAVRFLPDYFDAHLALAMMLEKEGRHEEALAHAEEAVRLAPKDSRGQQLLAELQAKNAPPKQVPPAKKDECSVSLRLMDKAA